MIRCTVRGCSQALTLDVRQAVCPRGHAFDRARAGYWNLLQPQDRRSLEAGDSKVVVAARRRLFEAGFFAPLTEALGVLTPDSSLPSGRVMVLDVGCGEGGHLAALCEHLGIAAAGIGIDLSVPAVELAAKTHPGLTWIASNADRGLPLLDRSVDLALSITARRPVAELARVLRPGGFLLIAVPAPDDLTELRAAVLGDDDRRDRFSTVLAELEAVPGAFEIVVRRTVHHQARLDPQALRDLAATTYRGGRRAREERLEAFVERERVVTGAWEIAGVRRR